MAMLMRVLGLLSPMPTTRLLMSRQLKMMASQSNRMQWQSDGKMVLSEPDEEKGRFDQRSFDSYTLMTFSISSFYRAMTMLFTVSGFAFWLFSSSPGRRPI